MARKGSSNFGSMHGAPENFYQRRPSPPNRTAPLYPAPGANGPMQQLMRVESVPGSPNFAHDEAEKELSSFIGLGHPKSYRVGIHSAHDKNMPKASGPIAEDGASAVAFRPGLDSAE